VRSKKRESSTTESSAPPEGARIGRIVAFDGSQVKVQHDGLPGASLAARVSAALPDEALAAAARSRQEGLLLFEGGDPSRPVLVSLLRSATPLIDEVLAGPLPARRKMARVDGVQVAIEGQEEVVLRCGRASLTLRRDGKILLRGVNVVSQADEVQKIRGGKVQIN